MTNTTRASWIGQEREESDEIGGSKQRRFDVAAVKEEAVTGRDPQVKFWSVDNPVLTVKTVSLRPTRRQRP